MLGLILAGLVAVVAPAPSAAPGDAACAIAKLPGLSRQFAAIRQSSLAGTRADFSRIAASILGEALDGDVDWSTRADLPCSPAVRARDRHAWQMAMVGYSATEIADVLDGRLSRADLDQARARLMAGHSRKLVADFLDARWRAPLAKPTEEDVPEMPELREAPLVAAVRRVRKAPRAAGATPARAAAVRDEPWLDVDLEQELETLERSHKVPAGLVRAMVAAESGGNRRAVSPAGAIGLMQLMPATAAALGVDPWHPRQNLRGGVSYLAELMRAYDGDVRLALIAYNAGPQHADRVRAGTAVAYRETRRYLDAIAARYPLP